MPAKILSQEVLSELLSYDDATGLLFWKDRGEQFIACEAKRRAWNTRFGGKEAFKSLDGHGYRRGRVLYDHYQAHRIIWTLVTGEWPDEIDHINGVRTDNRIANLRNVSSADNAKNLKMMARNESGRVGVFWSNSSSRWIAKITVQRKGIRLGAFSCKQAAIAAREEAERKYGFHPNHGRRASGGIS